MSVVVTGFSQFLVVSAFPAPPLVGQTVVLEADGRLYVYNGFAWIVGAGGAVENTRLSTGSLSALLVVRDTGDGQHIAAATPTDALGIMGIARTSAGAAEQPVVIVEYGEITDGSWAWAQGPVWMGALGMLTQTPPTAGSLVQAAEALSATRIMVFSRARIIRAP